MRKFPTRIAPQPLREQSGITRATVDPLLGVPNPAIGQSLFQIFRALLMKRYGQMKRRPDDER